MRTNWKHHEQYVRQNIDKKSVQEMANHLGVKPYDLDQFIHRERIFPVNNTFKNRAYEVVKKKFVHPEYFKPNRKFFRAIGMSQRQWWAVYRGAYPISDEHYLRLTEHLGLTLPEAIDLKQISINFPAGSAQ